MFKEFQEQYSKKYNEELNKTGLFWAFSNEQFEENKTYKDAPYSEYSLVFNGGYIHKSDMPKLEKFFNNIVPALKKEFTDNIKIEDFIEYELINHECYYTGDFSAVFDIMMQYYEMSIEDAYEKIKSVYDLTKDKKLEDFDENIQI